MASKLQWIWMVLFMLYSTPDISNARERSDGRCSTHEFLIEDNKIVRDNTVWVIMQKASVYAGAYGTETVRTLDFGTALLPFKQKNDRIQIKAYGAAKSMGWMASKDLLCAIEPLKLIVNGRETLERKLFIKPPPTPTDTKMRTVTAYPYPTGDICGRHCNQLSRFTRYFIVAETSLETPDQGRYLLSQRFNQKQIEGEGSPLMGWVKKTQGIPWNTTLGIRPKIEISSLNAYLQLEQAEQSLRSSTIRILGGKQWYGLPHRLALLEKIKYHGRSFYKVAAPAVGGFAPFEGHEQGIETLKERKRVDVFFTLDGTFSMKPFIKAAARTAEEIVTALLTEPAYQETSFRFGFRIYRDSFAGNQGIGETWMLDASTCHTIDFANMRQNAVKFRAALSNIETSKEDGVGDDYPEQLLAGLHQTAMDLGSCPNHTKLLFVIGDAGDRKTEVKDVIKQFKRYTGLIPFFIQTPRQAGKPEAYDRAYDKFTVQAQAILRGLIPTKSLEQDIDPTAHHLILGNQQLVGHLLEQVKIYSNSAEVNELILTLEGGQALETYLKKRMVAGDLPILQAELFHRTACKQLGKLCTESSDHRVIEAYIPVSNDWVEEVQMDREQLDNWIFLTTPIRSLHMSPKKARKRYARKLAKYLESILGQPPIGPSETIAAYIKRSGLLPVRKLSPFAQYSLLEIKNMESCVFNRLSAWVSAHNAMLHQIAQNPRKEPLFKMERYASGSCNLRDKKDQHIPKLIYKRETRTLNDSPGNDYSYRHTLRDDEIIYWLPTAFLP